MYHYLHEGRDIGISTKISHGEKEISIGLIKHMKRQMELDSIADFARFVECDMSATEYADLLRRKGKIPQN